ncbi:unnamed protein product [Lactuca virosa]|uniref:Uncharacterized protein n=1 Tax=Lactuca virosa TaxID=75947 RepID=A0AAU9NB59_9ASTR|nr:unnamed protein product [Lactuca virosa]
MVTCGTETELVAATAFHWEEAGDEVGACKYRLMVVVFFTAVFKKLSEANSLPHLCIYMVVAAADLTFIPDLDVLKDSFTMKLRVIRLWTLECYYNKDEIFSIQVILMDEQGNKIEGYVPNAYVYKFRKVLKEGEAFFIKNLNLAKIDEDVIGLVLAIGEIDARNEDRKRHKMRLQIHDVDGSQLDVNLWGDYCYKFSDYIQNNVNILRIVIILQFAKINVWQDRRYVNTYYDVSKFIINSDIDEIKVFKKRFMISVRVQDHTGSITLTMFEQDAKKLLKISAKDLVAKTAKLGFCTNVYPSDIKALKDMKLAFIVSVSKYNVQRNNNQYTISKISDDETLIEELDKKFVVAEGSNSQSFEHATSPKKNLDATKGLKRALEDDFVLDVNDNMSSSKATKVVGGEQHKLVIVKLEK